MLVLVVEDEVKMARALRRGLEQEGYSVELSLDGNDAMSRARERSSTRSSSTS
jgi:DNA-binding response OmpR family regulator